MKVIALVASLLSLAAYATANSTACTKSITTINPSLNVGPTSTKYLSTVTSTSSVDCGDCDTVVATRLPLGHGPVAHFTATVTVPEATTTAYVCAGKY